MTPNKSVRFHWDLKCPGLDFLTLEHVLYTKQTARMASWVDAPIYSPSLVILESTSLPSCCATIILLYNFNLIHLKWNFPVSSELLWLQMSTYSSALLIHVFLHLLMLRFDSYIIFFLLLSLPIFFFLLI